MQFVPGGNSYPYPFGAEASPLAPPHQVAPQGTQAPTMVPGVPSANPVMPNMAQLGRDGWYRMPFFPTAPFFSMDDRVGHMVRYYSAGVVNQPAGAEVTQTVQFDLPSRIIAINASAFDTGAFANLTGLNPRDMFLLRVEYSQGDRIMITQRLASTVAGTSERPGELGGSGWVVNPGGAFIVGITPLIANLRIDVTFHVLELRGARNFSTQ